MLTTDQLTAAIDRHEAKVEAAIDKRIAELEKAADGKLRAAYDYRTDKVQTVGSMESEALHDIADTYRDLRGKIYSLTGYLKDIADADPDNAAAVLAMVGVNMDVEVAA